MLIATSFLAPAIAAALNAVGLVGGVTPEPATQLGTAYSIDQHGAYVNGDRLAQLSVTVAGVTYMCADVPADHPAWDPCHTLNFQGIRFGVRW